MLSDLVAEHLQARRMELIADDVLAEHTAAMVADVVIEALDEYEAERVLDLVCLCGSSYTHQPTVSDCGRGDGSCHRAGGARGAARTEQRDTADTDGGALPRLIGRVLQWYWQEVSRYVAEKLVDSLCLQRMLELIATNAEPIVFGEYAQRTVDSVTLTVLMSHIVEARLTTFDELRMMRHNDADMLPPIADNWLPSPPCGPSDHYKRGCHAGTPTFDCITCANYCQTGADV